MIRQGKYFPLLLLFMILNCSSENEIPVVPSWATDAVWYQIFPERFNNGDKSNDPTSSDLAGCWPYVVPDRWQPHPWTSDWYKLQTWEQNGHDFYWNAQVRRYGGDLQGVIDKLDYLQNLGITAIYFNPVFESPSLHKYDVTYYHHIDNNFGPNPLKDKEIWNKENPADPNTWEWTTADLLFLQLIKEAHKKNIKIIIDGVFNHVGNTFWAFNDLEKKQEKSAFVKWFTINSFDNPNTEENEFDYEGWFGANDLPEIKEDENGLFEDAANHVHSIIKRWMDPNQDGDPSDGIDGWRLDVADMVNQKFWMKFRHWVKEINPEAYITGEIWWDNWETNKMMDASPWLKGDQFDAVMNYRFTRAVKNFISDQDSNVSSKAFVDSINNIRKDFNMENYYALMNLLGSHDTERLASLIVNPDYWYDHGAVPYQRKSFDVRKPNNIERKRQKLMVGIQMTMIGAPMVFYGDEAGMWGGDDPDCRKPMIWPENEYETETTHPYGLKRMHDEVHFDSTLFNWYKLMISIRNSNIELRRGNQIFINNTDKNILAYKRELGNNIIYILLNNSSDEKEIVFDKPNKSFTNLVNGENISTGNSGFKLTLKPYEIVILK